MVVFGIFCNVFLSERTKSVIRRLSEVEGLTTYAAVKSISSKEKLATSTVKYVLGKLRRAKVIDYNGSLKITDFGKMLGSDSLTQQSTRLQHNPFAKSVDGKTERSGSEARSLHFCKEVKI